VRVGPGDARVGNADWDDAVSTENSELRRGRAAEKKGRKEKKKNGGEKADMEVKGKPGNQLPKKDPRGSVKKISTEEKGEKRRDLLKKGRHLGGNNPNKGRSSLRLLSMVVPPEGRQKHEKGGKRKKDTTNHGGGCSLRKTDSFQLSCAILQGGGGGGEKRREKGGKRKTIIRRQSA